MEEELIDNIILFLSEFDEQIIYINYFIDNRIGALFPYEIYYSNNNDLQTQIKLFEKYCKIRKINNKLEKCILK